MLRHTLCFTGREVISLVAEPAPRSSNREANAARSCLHCGLRVYAAGEDFCCAGCAAVHALLHAEGMERYYDLASGRGAPQSLALGATDHKWIEALDAASGRISLDAQGIHCAACVWLFEKLFARQPGALSLQVNPALGTLRLVFEPAFSVSEFVRDVERFGYRLGPAHKDRGAPARDPLMMRMGICIALAINAMIFAVAFYAGLSSGPLYRLFRGVEFGLGTLSVLIGGWVFLRSAVLALKARVLHLDLPIALGIVLAFASSALAFFTNKSTTYFDTLSIFIALMLVGRWLQERVIVQNRRALLDNDGAEGLLTRRLEDGRAVLVPCNDIQEHDELLIAPGDLVPVEGTLLDTRASCSLDWINGESAALEYALGARIAAGAFNAGVTAFTLRAHSAFAESPVVELLRITRPREIDQARATPWWQRLARIYVAAVLVVAVLGFAGWALATGDLGRALEVTAGVLIVTCPCAFGIATPLGYELVYAGLRRAGLFVRSSGFLDRAPEVERIMFDKTGTLTTGRLVVENAAELLGLPAQHRDALYNLAARSAHPKSAAVAELLAPHARLQPGLLVEEQIGSGVQWTDAGHSYRLGARDGELAFSHDDTVLATLTLREVARADAQAELHALAQQGYEIWIVSGDGQTRVQELATALGVAPERVRAECTPQQKAELVQENPRTLMIGDGLNDSLAACGAFCSGTPAVDRPFMPARTDFYFTTAGIGPVALALRAARVLRDVTRRNLRVAVAYNAVSVALAWAGLLSPLVCAVIMPLSSITVVLATVFSLSPRSALWRP